MATFALEVSPYRRKDGTWLVKLRMTHNRRTLRKPTGIYATAAQLTRGLIPRQPASRHRDLTLPDLRRVLSVSPPTERAAVALDAFILSLCLAGINTADLYGLRKSDIRGGVLTYQRAKTDSRRDDKAEMQVRVEPEAAAVMARRKGSKALLDFSDRYSDFRAFNKACNQGLKVIGEAAGVDGLTTYHARHTWATLARNECGIPRDVVEEALNHVQRGGRVTDIYIRRDFSRVWEANRKVLDLVFGDIRR